MSHYTPEQWSDFKQHNLTETVCREMEQHLQVCDQCMDLWLELITDTEMAQAAQIIPDNFSQNTLKLAQAQPPLSLSANRSKRRKLMAYYTAAAAITLMLVSGGVFQSIVDGLSAESTHHVSAYQGPTQMLYSWPAWLGRTSHAYLQKIDLNQPRGVKR